MSFEEREVGEKEEKRVRCVGVCVFLYPTPSTRHGWKSVLQARAVSASVTQSVSQGPEGQSGNRGPAGRGAA